VRLEDLDDIGRTVKEKEGSDNETDSLVAVFGLS
jgi:hypothetical protein